MPPTGYIDPDRERRVGEVLDVDLAEVVELPPYDPRDELPPTTTSRRPRGRYLRATEVAARLEPFMEDARAGVPDSMLAQRSGLTTERVRQWRRRHGINGRRGRPSAAQGRAYMVAPLLGERVPPVAQDVASPVESLAEWRRSRADAVPALAHAQALARIILQRRGLSSDEIEAANDRALLMIPPRGPWHARAPAPASEVPRTLDAAVSALVQKVRGEAAHGPVRPRHVLFRKGEDGWRRLLLVAFGSPSDLDSDVTWASNRVARMLGATAAASVREDEADGALVEVERRGADAIELFVLRRGRTPIEQRLVTGTRFDILPGGDPDQGWGWQNHDSLLRETESQR